MDAVVGIGEWAVSQTPGATLRTFALASCVAVTAYSPVRKAAGMVHIALPAPLHESDERTRPAYFAETAIPCLVRRMGEQFGCLPGELVLGLYGGADSIRMDDRFRIGRRNIEAVSATLAAMGMRAKDKDLGGTVSRNLELDVETGEVRIRTQPIKI